MYYEDHRAVAEEEVTSHNFCCLVDAAVMLYEEEKEERVQRIFHLFPRKPRTPVKKPVTRRNPQQNPLQLPSSSRNPPLQRPSSSSSTLLFDLNTIPADDSDMNPNASSSSLDVYMMIAADCEMKNPQNPICSSSSLRNYKIVSESKDTEVRIPRNPNSHSSVSSCLTEETSRKRRAVQGKKRSGGKPKKAKVDAYSWIGKETPESLTLLMNDTNETVTKWGERTDLKLIFQRKLFKTDVNPCESRLSMPYNELIHKDFLTPAELRFIKEDINNAKTKRGVGAILVDEKNVKYGVLLKRWETKNGSWNYALTCGWNDIVKSNGLKLDDNLSIWSFRWGGLLCFALVTPPSME